jgi:soluble cytochrome b562
MPQGQGSSSTAPNPSAPEKKNEKAVAAEHTAPIVLDFGSKSRKQIRRLRKGRGKLINRIDRVLEDLRNNGNLSATAQPIIVVVKERKEDSLFGMFD